MSRSSMRSITRPAVAAMVACCVVLSACSPTEPERRPPAPEIDRTAVVIVGGLRARAPAEAGENFSTWPVQYSLSVLPSSASVLNLAYEGFGVIDPEVPVPDPAPQVADAVLMWIGEENIIGGAPPELLGRGITRLINNMDTGEQRFVLATLPTWDDQGLDAATLEPYNAQIRSLAEADPRVTLADVAAASPDGSDAAAIAAAFGAAYPG